MSVKEVLELWERLDRVGHSYVAPIETEEQYDAALGLLERIWGEVHENANSPYDALFRILVDHISAYEAEYLPIPDASPGEMVEFMMDQQGVTQRDVERATGIHQGNLSQIIRGKRNLTTQQIKALAEYFRVTPAVFL
ncbi:MAG: helix-turn-helix domain-containing protein [Trueperaceae bacterium]